MNFVGFLACPHISTHVKQATLISWIVNFSFFCCILMTINLSPSLIKKMNFAFLFILLILHQFSFSNSMLFKVQSAPANLNSHSENPNNSSESFEHLEGIEENQQQQDDYQSCHYVLQWWHYNNNNNNNTMSIERSQNQQLPNKRMPSWIDFIMVVIFERNRGAEIKAYVRHERGAVVELCLCNSYKSFCDGPFEAKQKYGGEIDLERPQCIKFDYQTIMDMNLKKKTANNEFLYIFDEFGVHKNSKSSDESNKQQESSSCSVTEPPLSFHRQMFMRIAYESATTKKSFGIWRLRKNDEFELILWD